MTKTQSYTFMRGEGPLDRYSVLLCELALLCRDARLDLSRGERPDYQENRQAIRELVRKIYDGFGDDEAMRTAADACWSAVGGSTGTALNSYLDGIGSWHS